MNEVKLVGKVTEFVRVKDKAIIHISVERPYKNKKGIYESDIIPCHLSKLKDNNLNLNLEDVVGIKGNLQIQNNKVIVVSEKLTFLFSKKKDDENDN